MRKFFRDLLSEDSKLSSMRFMALICVLAALLIAAYGIYKDRDLMGIATLVGAFLGPAFAAKVFSKSIENRPE